MKTWKLMMVLTLGVLFLLGAVGQAAAFGVKELDNETLVMNFHNEVVRGGYKVVSTAELKKWLDEKKPLLLVDTMPYEDSYKKNHIPGAVQMEFPIPEMTSLDEAKKAEFTKLLGPDKDRLLVFYCGFPKCTRSHNAAMWAVKLGYTNVYRHPGGIKAWLDADYPVAKVD